MDDEVNDGVNDGVNDEVNQVNNEVNRGLVNFVSGRSWVLSEWIRGRSDGRRRPPEFLENQLMNRAPLVDPLSFLVELPTVQDSFRLGEKNSRKGEQSAVPIPSCGNARSIEWAGPKKCGQTQTRSEGAAEA